MNTDGRTGKELIYRILLRFFYLVVPILVYLVLLGVFWFVFPPETGVFSMPPSPEYLGLIGLMGAYLVPPFGKETIIPLALALGYPVWVIFLGVVGMDIVTATFVSLNFDLLLRVPLIGRWIRWVVQLLTRSCEPSLGWSSWQVQVSCCLCTSLSRVQGRSPVR